MKSFLAFALVCAAAQFVTSRAADSRPNILFIAIDDLNDWIGCMKGHPQTKTPNIDRLAERGVLFTNAHCAAPVCLASRTAIFCGRYPHTTGVYSNWGATMGKAPPREWQLPVHLAAAGYETLGAGKLYHSSGPKFFDDYFETEQRWSPFSREQARYKDAERPSKGTNSPKHVIADGPGHREWVLPLNGLPSERNADSAEGESFDWGPAEVEDAEMGDARVTDWVVKKLGEKRTKPFFLGAGYYRPHIPLFAPKRDFDALPPVEEIKLPSVLAADLDDIGKQGRQTARDPITAGTHAIVAKNHQWQQAVRAYLACVTFVDRQIGRLIDQLDHSPHAQNTWIILWSDHGWHLGEKEHWGKWTGWRQATRVPLIIVPPRSSQSPRGSTCGAPVSLLDLYPTVAELCQLPKQDDAHGLSLVPLLAEPGRASDRRVLTSFDPGNYALSTDGWRFIRYASGEEELYDMGADQQEWHNLAASEAHRDRLATMRRQLDEMLHDAPPVTPDASGSKEKSRKGRPE